MRFTIGCLFFISSWGITFRAYMLLPLASTTNQVLAQHRVGREAVIVYALIKLCDSLSMLTTPTIVFLGWFLSYDYNSIFCVLG